MGGHIWKYLSIRAIFVIDRPQGSCGVCDIPEVLRDEAYTASEWSI